MENSEISNTPPRLDKKETKLNSETYDKLLNPSRMENETYEQYVLRRKHVNKVLKKYLKR